jgi:hypothetical protein
MLFIGSTRTHRMIDRARANGWGRLFVEKPTPRKGEPWALDNGVFSAWKAQTKWSAAAFLKSVEASEGLHAPTLAVLPDIVGGGSASIAHSLRWRAVLPDLPWYLAVQDGMTRAEVAAVLPDLAGLFLGGTDAFKATAPMWRELAHEHGKRFHYARVSTENRLKAALDCGADSADSSQMLWSVGPGSHWARFERWWHDANRQGSLFGSVPTGSTDNG